MAERSQHGVSGGQDGRSERPATGDGQPRTVASTPSGLRPKSPRGTVWQNRQCLVLDAPVIRLAAQAACSRRSARLLEVGVARRGLLRKTSGSGPPGRRRSVRRGPPARSRPAAAAQAGWDRIHVVEHLPDGVSFDHGIDNDLAPFVSAHMHGVRVTEQVVKIAEDLW